MTAPSAAIHVEVEAGDLEDLEALYSAFRGVPRITARFTAPPAEGHELGAVADILTVALTSGALTTFLQILKTLAESRGPAFQLKIRKGKDKVEISARDPEDGLEALKDLLDGS
jgi:hypothetical protein